MRGIRGASGLALASIALFSGCGRREPVPFATYAKPSEAPILDAASSNGFDEVALAGEDAVALGGKLAERGTLTGGQKLQLVRLLKRPLDRIAIAVARPSVYRFSPVDPLKPPLRRQGWDLLGKALTWRIENAVESGQYDSAIRDLSTSLRFGFLISGGDVSDASLGFSIADSARRAIAPALDQMGAGQLGQLASRTWSALEVKPLLDQPFDNELQNALTMVDRVQAAHRQGEMEMFYSALAADGDELKNKMSDFSPDSSKRKEFFDNLAKEAEEEHEWLSGKVRIPANRRNMDEAPKRNRFRPWLLLSRHYVMVGRRLLDLNDQTLARTRLLAIEAKALQVAKATGSAPRNLDFAPPFAKQDPYTGSPLGYRTIGRDFIAYSVGANFTDEAGESDLTYTEPDLRLERPAL